MQGHRPCADSVRGTITSRASSRPCTQIRMLLAALQWGSCASMLREGEGSGRTETEGVAEHAAAES